MASLGHRIFSASIWFSAGFVLVKLLALVRLAILARLLPQDQFGLMAIVVLVVTSLWALSDAGIETAVVQEQHASERWLHTAWQMNWMRGMLLASICILTAYPASLFFHRPELTSLLMWAAFIPLIHGFTSLGYPLLQKSLNFKKRVWVDISKESVFTLTSIVLALWWQADVRALIFGLIAATLAWVIVSFLVHDFRPRCLFDIDSARRIWSFGIHLLGAGVLIFLMTNLDDAMVGRLLGMKPLGQYAMAFALAGLLTSQLVELLNGVLFPALSSIQHDPERIRSVLSTTLRLVSGMLTPIVLAVLLAPELPVRMAFGDGWLMIVPALAALVLMGWMRGMGKVLGLAILALGLARKLHWMKWIEFGLFSALIVPLILWWGIVGAAVTLLLVYTLSLVLHVRVLAGSLGQITPLLVAGLRGAAPAALAFSPSLALRMMMPAGLIYQWLLLLFFGICWGGVFYYLERRIVMDAWRERFS